MTEKNEKWRTILDDVVDYEQTVSALLAFVALILHDGASRRPNTEFGFGRRMTTSPVNSVQPDVEVTPDLVAQRSVSYGVVAEAKKSLSREMSQWTQHLKRLLKYDDDLKGWWTDGENIPQSDTIMLIHQSRSRQFSKFLEAEKGKNPSAVGPKTSVVEFNQSEETVNYFFFRLENGKISDEELSKSLDFGVPVPLDKVIQSFPSVRYYDAQPPSVLLLTQLWTDYLPSMLSEATYDEKAKARRIRVSVTATTREFQAAYGSGTLRKDARSVEFPRVRWIRDALEQLVKHKLAIPSPDNSDEYVVLYRALRGDVRERFAKLEVGSSGQKSMGEPGQMPLFPSEEG